MTMIIAISGSSKSNDDIFSRHQTPRGQVEACSLASRSGGEGAVPSPAEALAPFIPFPRPC